MVALRASGEVHKADAVYGRLLTAGLVQPWSTEEASTLDVSRLYITAVAEAAVRTVLHDMCSHTSNVPTAAATPVASSSSGEQYYVHDAARDLHIITRLQQCSSTTDTAESSGDHDNSSDADDDADEYSSVLQLCVTELLEQLDLPFSFDDTNGRATVPAASLQQYVARMTGAATE
eukprot:14704-Heterococcus_DN1.PRE.3